MSAKNLIRMLIVDDHPLFRKGVAAILESEADMVVAAEASHGREAVELFRTHRPDITLMDIQMPVMNGFDAITEIRKHSPHARIIVLAAEGGDAHVARAFKAGAAAYLLKTTFRKELVETIHIVLAGRRRVPPELAMAVAEHLGDDALTTREIDVLLQVAAGHANKIVADNLYIAKETVKTHVSSILSKLAAKDRTHAVTIALKRGFIEI